MAVISGLPEAVSSHNISEKQTRNASGRDLAYVFDSVNGTTTDDMDQFQAYLSRLCYPNLLQLHLPPVKF